MEQFEAFSEFLRQITGVCGNYTQTTVPVSYVLQDGAKTQSSLMVSTYSVFLNLNEIFMLVLACGKTFAIPSCFGGLACASIV